LIYRKLFDLLKTFIDGTLASAKKGAFLRDFSAGEDQAGRGRAWKIMAVAGGFGLCVFSRFDKQARRPERELILSLILQRNAVAFRHSVKRAAVDVQNFRRPRAIAAGDFQNVH
jgi:hypothetical protein